jgi:uncharacterized membrane protein HdeD (DUF308 family)
MNILLLFLAHYVADFVCQSRKMAENKSKDHRWLLKHVGVYALVLGILTFPIFQYSDLFLIWVILNFVIHLGTDAITSRLAAHFYQKKSMGAFWRVIGIDQMSHYVVLYYTYIWLN